MVFMVIGWWVAALGLELSFGFGLARLPLVDMFMRKFTKSLSGCC